MKSFFYLQRADRYALIALLAVVVAAVGLLLYLGKPGETASAVAVDSTAVDSAGVGPGRVRPHAVRYYAVEGRRAELFAFDPNTADSTELLRLGLAPWQVRNIYKYRASGGIYRKPSDFARLYGLTVGSTRLLNRIYGYRPTTVRLPGWR